MPIPGPWELILLLVIVLIIFGPGKLPDIGNAVGKESASSARPQRPRGVGTRRAEATRHAAGGGAAHGRRFGPNPLTRVTVGPPRRE